MINPLGSIWYISGFQKLLKGVGLVENRNAIYIFGGLGGVGPIMFNCTYTHTSFYARDIFSCTHTHILHATLHMFFVAHAHIVPATLETSSLAHTHRAVVTAPGCLLGFTENIPTSFKKLVRFALLNSNQKNSVKRRRFDHVPPKTRANFYQPDAY